MTARYVGTQAGDYGRLSDAVRAAQDGDTIYVRAGVYLDDPVTINHDLSIVGLGGKAHLTATRPVGNGKALIIANADLHVKDLEFSGAHVVDHNGAGIRHQAGDLTIDSAYFHDNDNGVLGNDGAGRLIVRDSEFARNGFGDGHSHGLYVNNASYLEVTGSYFHDTDEGHLIKSRAAVTIIKNNVLDDGQADTSYSIAIAEGGRAIIADNTIIQGANGANRTLIAYAGEGVAYADNSLVVANNILANHDASGTANTSVLLRNWANGVTAEITENALYRINTLAIGPARATDNETLRVPPEIDFDRPGYHPAGLSLVGTPTADRLVGGAGDDVLAGLDGADTLLGLGGRDALRGGNGGDNIDGGTGNDTLFGDSRSDSLLGGTGDDRLFGGSFSDRLDGGAGDDSLAGEAGNDILIGDTGNDVAVYSGRFAQYLVKPGTVWAPASTPDYGKDNLSGIETLRFADGTYDVPGQAFTPDVAVVHFDLLMS